MCFINDLLVWFILVLIAPSSPEQVGRWVTRTSTSAGCRIPPRMAIKMLLNECFKYETDVWVTERRRYELRGNGRRSHDNWVAALMSVRRKGEKFHQRRARVRSRSDFAGDFWIRFLPFMFAWRLRRSLVVNVCLSHYFWRCCVKQAALIGCQVMDGQRLLWASAETCRMLDALIVSCHINRDLSAHHS